MLPNDELDLDLLERHFAGQTTAEEAERLDRWLAADPAREPVVASLRRVWESGQTLPRSWDVSAMWGQLSDRIQVEERRQAAAHRPRLVRPASDYGSGLGYGAGKRWYHRVALPLAAAAALIVAVAGGLLWSDLADRPTPGDRQAPMREFATARGERAEVRLNDATRVLLGPATRLRIPADFGGRSRDVYLEGEAFFDVTHDERRPFNVHAGPAVARDLGTKFSISAYPDANGVQVVVAEGLVALQPDSAPDAAPAMLRPGDLGRLAPTGETAVIRGVRLDRYLDWTTGRLVFEDVPLREALPRLERWYDVTIVLADSAMAARRLTATFKDQPASQVLDALALLLRAKVERQGKTAHFHPVKESR